MVDWVMIVFRKMPEEDALWFMGVPFICRHLIYFQLISIIKSQLLK